jgi:uncharacterized cupin superfamily protein
MSKRAWLLVLTALSLGFVGGVALQRGLAAQQAPVNRKILLTTDEPGSATHELVMALVEIAPGGSTGRHRHPGIELGYVMEGSLEVQRDGQATEILGAGQPFKNDGFHTATNRGATPTRLLAVFAVEKGKPMAEAAPAGE